MSTPRAYQRVNTATDYDYDFSKFPAYLKFDGVDDSMYTAASVDFTSTDKMTVFAGVHKASDAVTFGVVVEHSVTGSNTSGGFSVYAPAYAGTYGVGVNGTLQSWGELTGNTAPISNVLAASLSSTGASRSQMVTVRNNGAVATLSGGVSNASTGNFGNYPLYVGRRNNASLPFNGRLYQLAIKGKALSAAEISTLESYINSKTKAF